MVQNCNIFSYLFAKYVDHCGNESFHVEPSCLFTDNKVCDGFGKSARLLCKVADEGANLELGVDFGRRVSHENRQSRRAELVGKVWSLTFSIRFDVSQLTVNSLCQ